MSQDKKSKKMHVVKFKQNDGEIIDKEVASKNRLKQDFKKFNAQEKYEIEDNQGWVAWGQDNMRPQYLGFLYKNSGLHRAIIDGFSQVAAGLGTGIELIDKQLVQMFRQFAIYGVAPVEVIYSADGQSIADVCVLSMANIRFSWDKSKFQMNGAYYSRDWTQPKSARGKVKKLNLFNPLAKFQKDESGEPVLVQPKQILFVMSPAEDGRYYPDPAYEGGINWIEIDRQTGEFHRNSLENGLFPSMMVTVKGKLEPEEEDAVIDNLQEQLQGASNTGKFVVNFTDIEGGFEFTPITTNEADKLYQWHVDTAAEKILQSHGVVSPLLFGIRTATGFGGNADEMKTGEAIYNERVIKPAQKLFEQQLSRVFPNIKITPKPSFFQMETASVQQSADPEKKKFDENFLDEHINSIAEVLGEDWIEIDSYEAMMDEDDADMFVSTGTARPNARSSQDKTIDGVTFYARYVYDGAPNGERPFCRKMIAANKIYRKEDIMAMSDIAVNPGWGPRGADTYSIWLYKGGGNCKHFWTKKIYVSAKDLGVDINSPNAKTIAIERAKAKGFNPRNNRLVPIRPADMPNNGFLPKD